MDKLRRVRERSFFMNTPKKLKPYFLTLWIHKVRARDFLWKYLQCGAQMRGVGLKPKLLPQFMRAVLGGKKCILDVF